MATSTRLFMKSFPHGLLNHSLIKGSSGAFLVKVLGTGLTFGFHVMLSRILGSSAYGDYVYVITWVNIFALIGLCGFGNASLKYIALFKAKEQWRLLKGFIQRSTRLSMSFSTGMTVLLGVVLWTLKAKMPESLLRAFQSALLLLPIYVYLNLSLARLRGLKRPIIAELLFTTLRPLLVMAAIFIYANGIENRGASAANALICETMVICGLIWIAVTAQKKNLPTAMFKAPSRVLTREWLGIAFPLMLLSLFHMINSRADIVVIGLYCQTSDVAVYNAANKIAVLASFGLIAINNVLAPMIAQLHGQGEKTRLQHTVLISAWASVILCAPVAGGIILLEPYLFGLFGPSYMAGDIPLKILLLCQIINILAGPVGILLTMTAHHRMATKMMGLSAIINLGLNFGLVPRFGIIGAAVATGLSTLTWNAAMLIQVVSKLNINPTIFQMTTPAERKSDTQ